MKSFVRDFIPPILLRFLRRWRSTVSHAGNYPTWSDALKASEGYSAQGVLDHAAAAARKVRAGEAAFERDGIPFQNPGWNWPIIASLLHAAARNAGDLQVIDFGGSLGSTYFQHSYFLQGLNSVSWRVVEQPAWVDLGRNEFSGDELTFHDSLAEACADGAADIVLLSSVLPYLEDPHAVVDSILGMRPSFILVDRTGFLHSGDRDRLTVQRVRKPLCPSSYPSWFFCRLSFDRHFSNDYEIVAEWLNDDVTNNPAQYRGMLWSRRP